MRIAQLTAKNVKRLKAVEVKPSDDGLTIIAGKNGQGKSSVLDSIAYALGGKKLVPDEPIRQGEDKAEITVGLEGDEADYTVTRTFTENGSYLKVETGEGAELKSPQSILDSLLGDLTFDPLEFTRLSAKEQRDTLLQLAGVDVEAIDKRREKKYQERRDVNRDLKRVKGALEEEPEVPDDVPDAPISIADLSEELDQARTHNQQIENLRERGVAASEKIERLEAELAGAKEELESITAELNELGDKKDTPHLQEQIEQAEDTNRLVMAKKRKSALQDEVRQYEEKSQELTDAIESIDQEKTDALNNADLPVEGIGIDGDHATYEGVPFDQCAASEQLLVSTALGMALNPDLRVLRIADGSLLDEENLELMRELAQGSDYDIWMERVEQGGASVIIEDGEVAND